MTKPTPTPTPARSPLSPNPDILRDRPAPNSRAGNRAGKESSGLYPEVSRTKLGKKVGKCPSTITGVLNGRQKPTFELAGKMAREMGVGLEGLLIALEEQQAEWKRERVRKNTRQTRILKGKRTTR